MGLDVVALALAAANAKNKGDKSELDTLAKIIDGTYEGTDLTVKFADEISASPYNGDSWSWIQARITDGNFDGVHVYDWISFTANGATYHAEVMGINCYKGYGDTPIGNHIDFCSKELWPQSYRVNPVGYNCGVPAFTVGGVTYPAVPYSWLACELYHYINSLAGYVPNSTSTTPDMLAVDYTQGGVYYYLPPELKAVISQKRMLLTHREATGASLPTTDNGYTYANIGNLWLPSELEIYGHGVWGGVSGYPAALGSVKYPYFNNAGRCAKKQNGAAAIWRILTPRNGNASQWCMVSSGGTLGTYGLTTAFGFPICFRIAASA